MMNLVNKISVRMLRIQGLNVVTVEGEFCVRGESNLSELKGVLTTFGTYRGIGIRADVGLSTCYVGQTHSLLMHATCERSSSRSGPQS